MEENYLQIFEYENFRIRMKFFEKSYVFRKINTFNTHERIGSQIVNYNVTSNQKSFYTLLTDVFSEGFRSANKNGDKMKKRRT